MVCEKKVVAEKNDRSEKLSETSLVPVAREQLFHPNLLQKSGLNEHE